MRISAINDYEIVLNDFIKNRWDKFGYLNYRTFARRIIILIKNDNEYRVRKVFNTLIQLGYILRINKPKKYLYKCYNPDIDNAPKKFIIHFD
jgi:hypothetical protein